MRLPRSTEMTIKNALNELERRGVDTEISYSASISRIMPNTLLWNDDDYIVETQSWTSSDVFSAIAKSFD